MFGISKFDKNSDNTDITDITDNDIICSLQNAGQIHKQVRHHLHTLNLLRPGANLVHIANEIETKTRELIVQKKYQSIYGGIGFPVGLSINECAAHFHPLADEMRTLHKTDIVKVDFGVEVNGWIIDSAFTVYFDEANESFTNLTNGVREATYTGIKNAGVDVDINEWSRNIKEVMDSYEIHPITNLGGHNILKELIHGGVFLPAVPTPNLPVSRFTEGVYAIETFGSTGDNYVHEIGQSTIYRVNPTAPVVPPSLKLESSRKYYSKIRQTFKTLPFTNRFVDNITGIGLGSKTQLEILTKNQCVYSYPPLCVKSGMTAQYEHTIYISDNKKPIVFSQSDDY